MARTVTDRERRPPLLGRGPGLRPLGRRLLRRRPAARPPGGHAARQHDVVVPPPTAPASAARAPSGGDYSGADFNSDDFGGGFGDGGGGGSVTAAASAAEATGASAAASERRAPLGPARGGGLRPRPLSVRARGRRLSRPRPRPLGAEEPPVARARREVRIAPYGGPAGLPAQMQHLVGPQVHAHMRAVARRPAVDRPAVEQHQIQRLRTVHPSGRPLVRPEFRRAQRRYQQAEVAEHGIGVALAVRAAGQVGEGVGGGRRRATSAAPPGAYDGHSGVVAPGWRAPE